MSRAKHIIKSALANFSAGDIDAAKDFALGLPPNAGHPIWRLDTRSLRRRIRTHPFHVLSVWRRKYGGINGVVSYNGEDPTGYASERLKAILTDHVHDKLGNADKNVRCDVWCCYPDVRRVHIDFSIEPNEIAYS